MATVKYLIAGVLLQALVANGLPGDPCSPECPNYNQLLPNPRDCTKYYQCVGGVAVPRTCPDGTYFNPTFAVCDYPDHSGCTADPDFDCWGTTARPVSTAPPAETTAAPVVTTADQETTAGAEETTAAAVETTAAAVDTTAAATTAAAVDTTAAAVVTTEPAECIPPCPSNEAVYPNPRDCNSYFQCSNGDPYLFYCYFGLYFNPETGKCDFPSNVDCTAGPDAPCVAVTASPSS
ncbi:Chitin binding domain [Trinorchestia longiramus]|nr:Chitin binding domain [Trinorchestia longiramus]